MKTPVGSSQPGNGATAVATLKTREAARKGQAMPAAIPWQQTACRFEGDYLAVFRESRHRSSLYPRRCRVFTTARWFPSATALPVCSALRFARAIRISTRVGATTA